MIGPFLFLVYSSLYRDPTVDRAFTFTHTNFDRLRSYRGVREDADPNTALTLHMTGHGTTGSFDLAGRHTLGRGGFQTVSAEVQIRAALGFALDPAFLNFAEFSTLWLKHCSCPP